MGKFKNKLTIGAKLHSFKLAESTMEELRSIAERQSKATGAKFSTTDAVRFAARSCARNDKGTAYAMLPHYGEVPCGKEIDVDSPPPALLDVFAPIARGSDRFALEAVGDSMIGKQIRAGDTLIVQKQKIAENGQVVVARTEFGMTVKTFATKKEGRKTELWLLPANDAYEPIRFNPETMEIVGVLVGLVRKF